MRSRFKSGIDAIIMWVEFVAGYRLCPEWFFSRYASFSQIPIQQGMVGDEALCGCATPKSLFILFTIISQHITEECVLDSL